MKKIMTTALLVFVAASFAFAGGGKETDSAAERGKTTWTVGICQLVQHTALDAATKGFRDALTDRLGDKVTFIEQNASGEINNCATIVNGFVSHKVDLILANATPALQAAASATGEIPVLGTAITHYGTALDIANYTGVIGGNISGTSDLAPLDEQARMITEWFPNARRVALLYCSAEPNSIFQIEQVESFLNAERVSTGRYSFTDTNDIAAVAERACRECDVIYIPTDNTAASNTEAIANIVVSTGTPVIAGEEGICSGCGVATLSISYYDLGRTTGEMAARILADGADISKMRVEYTEVTRKYNPLMCQALGITPLPGYEAIGN